MTVISTPQYVHDYCRIRRKRKYDPPFIGSENILLVDDSRTFRIHTQSKDVRRNGAGWRKSLGVSDVGLGYSLNSRKYNFKPDSAFVDYRIIGGNPYGPGEGHYYLDGVPSSVITGITQDPSTIGTSDADLQAKSRAVSQVKDLYNAFQGGVFLGELRESIRMIRNPAMALRSGIDSFFRSVKKRTKMKSLREANKVIAGTWLEYQYGWAPLASDIESACETAYGLGRHFVTKRFRATGKTQSMAVSHRTYTIPSDSVTWRWEIRIESEAQVNYSGSVAGGNVNAAPPMYQTWGLGLRNVIPTAYELIPYSFLVDYFSNIGGIIDCLSYCSGNLAWMSKSIKRRRHSYITGLVLLNPSSDITNHGENNGGTSLEWVSFTRNILVPSAFELLPPLAFKLPGSSTKFLNIGALASMRTLR